jgi:hypothetical protein
MIGAIEASRYSERVTKMQVRESARKEAIQLPVR